MSSGAGCCLSISHGMCSTCLIAVRTKFCKSAREKNLDPKLHLAVCVCLSTLQIAGIIYVVLGSEAKWYGSRVLDLCATNSYLISAWKGKVIRSVTLTRQFLPNHQVTHSGYRCINNTHQRIHCSVADPHIKLLQSIVNVILSRKSCNRAHTCCCWRIWFAAIIVSRRTFSDLFGKHKVCVVKMLKCWYKNVWCELWHRSQSRTCWRHSCASKFQTFIRHGDPCIACDLAH